MSLVEIVVPTVGRPSLYDLLRRLATFDLDLLPRITLVDDRRTPRGELVRAALSERFGDRLRVVRGAARGPAAARNVGWLGAEAPWVAFLDDDVVPARDWLPRLHHDLARLPDDVVGSQGRIVVPRPLGRRPTDWERNVIALERARWATADLAYRRSALAAAGGFDERFPRAYREDADLGLRLTRRGRRIVRGQRRVFHPARPAGFWVSVRRQAGNADDALMRALHGPGWRDPAGAPPGRRAWHVATTLAALGAVAGVASRRRALTRVGGALWLLATADFAWRRIAPGPRTAREIARMCSTSTILPLAATFHWLRGVRDARGAAPWTSRSAPARPLDAVLLDRDGTIVVDVPENGDPTRVVAMPLARRALDRLRAAGVRLAVVSNQAAVARGTLRLDQVEAVNRQIERQLGPFDLWLVCPHGPDDGCACRKPAPGMVRRALALLDVAPGRCALVGDTGADVAAARAAGVRAILVPNDVTRRDEVAEAPEVARDLDEAARRLLAGAA
ncbi:MAG: HAD-IIIA family hydrolase [Thermodesulfobacteriota bacterium]